MEKKVLNSMFDNLLHIGQKTNYWNPRMKGYIYASVNGVHVINLLETAKKIEEVKAQVSELTANGKKVLFVGTKLQARDAVTKVAKETGSYYVCEKWVPGLLTNFKTIKKRIGSYIKLMQDKENGNLDRLTKKEKAEKLHELEKLHKSFIGVKDMKKTPDFIFVVDGVYEEQAIREAKSLGIQAFAVLNTNGDDLKVDNCIPANTNAVKSIDYIMSEIGASFSTPRKQSTKPNVKKVDNSKREITVKKAETVEKKKTTTKKAAPKKAAKKEEAKTTEK